MKRQRLRLSDEEFKKNQRLTVEQYLANNATDTVFDIEEEET